MNDHDATPQSEPAPTQSELYDSLKRIGELEDQKQGLQAEIDQRTEQLRESMSHLDRESLLYRMLSTALKPAASAAPARAAKKKSAKKARKTRAR